MRHHYLSHDLNPSAQCYGLFDEKELIGFCAVTHFPHPRNPKIKHCHRLVILPDYQGIGLGTKFLSSVAKMYADKGFDFSITTSAKNLMFALNRNENWGCQSYRRNPLHHGFIKTTMNRASSNKRQTASFYWKGRA